VRIASPSDTRQKFTRPYPAWNLHTVQNWTLFVSLQQWICMPNVYFWEPEIQNHGILHAVLSWDECDRVLDCATATHLGADFSSGSINLCGSATVAILYVRPEEANDVWTAGFYRIDADPMVIRERIRVFKKTPSIFAGTNGRRS
jgi:hypothetical protein